MLLCLMNCEVIDIHLVSSDKMADLSLSECENMEFTGELEEGVDVIYPMMSRRERLGSIKTFSTETQVGRSMF